MRFPRIKTNDACRFESDTSARDVLARIDEPMFSLDGSGSLTFANPAAADLLGGAESAPIGEPVWNRVADHIGSTAHERLRDAVETEEPAQFRAYADSVSTWFRVTASPSASGVTVRLSPITDHDSVLLTEAADAAMDGIAILDDEGEHMYANRAYAEIFGYERTELLGTNWRQLYGEPEQEWLEQEVFPRLNREGEWGGEVVGRCRDGSTVTQDVSLSFLEDGSVICTTRDISEQKRRERELERQRTRIRTLFDKSPDGIVVHDTEGAVIDVNETICETLGIEREALLSMNVSEFTVSHTQEELLALWAEMDDGDVVKTTGEHRRNDGDIFPVEVWVNKVTVDGNERFIALDREITDRVEQRRELEETKERLDLAVEGAGIVIWDWDMTTDTVTFNDQWAEMLGLSPDDIDPHLDTWEERIHTDDMDHVKTTLDAHLAGEAEKYDSEHRMRTADGDWKWVRDAGKIVEHDDEGTPTRAVGILHDITARKEYEQTLEQTREELRQIIDLVPDLIFVKDKDGVYLLANEATADAYGLDPESVEGGTEADLIPDLEESAEFREDDLRVIESGEPLEIPEEELTTADGETRTLRTTKIPYTVAGSEKDAVLGYGRDITELKDYERQLESQRDNLNVLNQVVRHDIRNNLNVVVGYAELLDAHVDEAGEEYLEPVLNAAKDAIGITASAREVTELLLQADAELTRTDIQPVLQHRIEDARSGDHSALITPVGQLPDVSVFADDMLGSVFRNLLHNAVFHNDADVPEIHVSTEETPETVRIAIADNGPGIPDDRKENIFDEGIQGIDSEGSGLGLYLVQKLVGRYDGSVWVEDNDRGGATFIVELPLADA